MVGLISGIPSSLVYAILKVENKVGARAILEATKEVLIHEGLDENSGVTFHLLKDGVPSFVGPCRDLGMKPLACTAHIGRPFGSGTVGRNDRGSLETYLVTRKKVPATEAQKIVLIFWAFTDLPCKKTYETSRKLLVHYLLTKFISAKENHTSPLAESATIEEALEYSKNYD